VTYLQRDRLPMRAVIADPPSEPDPGCYLQLDAPKMLQEYYALFDVVAEAFGLLDTFVVASYAGEDEALFRVAPLPNGAESIGLHEQLYDAQRERSLSEVMPSFVEEWAESWLDLIRVPAGGINVHPDSAATGTSFHPSIPAVR